MSDADNQSTDESTADTPEVGAITDPEPIEGRPWTDKAMLEQHLNDGSRLREMTTTFDGDRVELLKWIRAYDLEPNYGRNTPSRYQSAEDIPVVGSGTSLEHAIPASITEWLGLDGGVPIRFTPKFDREAVRMTVELEAGEGVDGNRSNERPLVRRETRHLIARYPTRLAAALELFDHANETIAGGSDDSLFDASIEVTSPVDARMTVSFETPPPFKTLHTRVERESAVERLDSVARPLWATPEKGSSKFVDLDVDDDFHFRLDLPVASADGDTNHRAYVDAYGLEPNQKVGLHVGVVPVDGTAELGIIVDVDPAFDTLHKSQIATLNQKNAGLGQLALYPGMSLLHALGIGVDTVEPKVRLVPGDGQFGIVAASDDASGLVSEGRVREAVEGAEVWADVVEALDVSFPTAVRYVSTYGYDLDTDT